MGQGASQVLRHWWYIGGQLVFFWSVRPGHPDGHRYQYLRPDSCSNSLMVPAREVVTPGLCRMYRILEILSVKQNPQI